MMTPPVQFVNQRKQLIETLDMTEESNCFLFGLVPDCAPLERVTGFVATPIKLSRLDRATARLASYTPSIWIPSSPPYPSSRSLRKLVVTIVEAIAMNSFATLVVGYWQESLGGTTDRNVRMPSAYCDDKMHKLSHIRAKSTVVSACRAVFERFSDKVGLHNIEWDGVVADYLCAWAINQGISNIPPEDLPPTSSSLCHSKSPTLQLRSLEHMPDCSRVVYVVTKQPSSTHLLWASCVFVTFTSGPLAVSVCASPEQLTDGMCKPLHCC